MEAQTLTERDLTLPDGRTLHVYDTGGQDARLTVLWHHGTPNVGRPPEPLRALSGTLGVRWVSFDRPGYGSSTRHPGRDLASVAADASHVLDALGVQRFAAMGHSGGGPHALACAAWMGAARMGERVSGVACLAPLAPYGALGLDWFAGMWPSGVAALEAALAGRDVKERFEASDPPFDPQMFTPADHAALQGEWAWLNTVVGPAMLNGPGGLVDDDLAYVSPWGFTPDRVTAPTLLAHGTDDRVVPASHSEWLARHLPRAELRLRPGDGHLSVLHGAADALTWLTEQV
ncbi:alpha/beta fold hydrolase [Deinococcus aquiradiocola]|uniref:Alpha/beta hydrolase n=1 Tax=Deinococcus aquiradiocola TaxID=393059 RepID=A0A917PCS5_9DEIO|nr:alpha/beta fold hydrolase [Deinococcus aquiradiocola]GGJ70998.1 alpha/beta hydrolase [Deinococcus aquiradiocola]